jgi:hypothetical protein
MKTKLIVNALGLILLAAVPSWAQQPGRAVFTGKTTAVQLQGGQVISKMTDVLTRPGLSFAKQHLLTTGFKQGNLEKDVLRVTGKVTLKDGTTQDVEVNLVGFEKGNEIAVVGNYMVGNNKYEAILTGTKGNNLDQFDENEVVLVSNKFQLEKLGKGPNPGDYQPTETYELRPTLPSRRRIRRFLSCLGSEIRSSCTSQCTGSAIDNCVKTGGLIGSVIGAAVGTAVEPGGGTIVGVAIGSVAGFVACLGWTCGFCVAGQTVECSVGLF